MHGDSIDMGRKLNLSHLSQEETEKILEVIQKDFHLRELEKQRIGTIEKVVKEEEDKESVLAKKTNLNENVCVRCCQTFGLIFNRRQICQQCKLFVCKRCCKYDAGVKGHVCDACIKERELKLKSCEWFYNNVSRKFKRFGSAKVVRTLYKQRSNLHRQYHTDNEEDSGYGHSLHSSLKSPSILSRASVHHGMYQSEPEGDDEIDTVGPAPILVSSPRTSLAENLKNDNRNNNNINNNNNNDGQQEEDNKEKDKQDIYKEAFDHYRQTEEKKFHTKFDSILKQLYASLEEPAQNRGDHFGSTSYGQVIEKYRNQLKEMLVGVSQRLEMAVESFDSSPNQSFVDTSQKVRKLVSKLVEDSFGESIDVTSDEAVSDLSSLSDDSGDHQVKSFEDQIAQAVVARVLENFRRDANIDIPLDLLDGSFSEDPVSDKTHDSHVTDYDKSHDHHSKGTSSDDEASVISKHSYGCQVDEEKHPVRDFGIQSEDDNLEDRHRENITETKISHDFGVQSEFSEPEVLVRRTPNLQDSCVQSEFDDSLNLQRPETEDFGVQSEFSARSGSVHHRPQTEDCAVQSELPATEHLISPHSTREVNISASIHSNQGSSINGTGPVHECIEAEIVDKSFSSNNYLSEDRSGFDSDSKLLSEDTTSGPKTEEESERTLQSDLAELKQFSQRVRNTTPVRKREVEEVVEFDEEPIEKVTVDREELQSEFVSRVSKYDRLHDSHVPLPDFSDDYEDNEFFHNEVDPDLLSMNLAPILEEEEEDYVEDDEEEEEEGAGNSAYGKNWRDNWIFNNSKFSPYSNLGKRLSGGFDQVYLTIPDPDEELAPKIGNRDADLMSDTISEVDEDREHDELSDDESSFFAKNMDEITRITSRKSSTTSSVPAVSSGIQTDSEMDTSFETSVSTAKKAEPQLIEELIPAENDDPKFDPPPESESVHEGDVAKFTCRVRGSEPIDVIWYKIDDGELVELEDSEFYELSRDQNRHTLTVYNPTQPVAGQYMCMALNDKGHCSQYLILTIKNKKSTQEFKKPEFLKEIEDVEVKEGQNVKFRAKVKGYPPPRVVWYKDGQFLKHGGNYRIEKFGNRDYILTIEDATPQDDAEYWVVARNVAGDVKSTAQLIVESKELDLASKTKEIKTPSLPKNKDDQQLANMGRKLFMTRERMEKETEDMIQSADKLNSLHESLDEFESILNSFEQEINSTNSPTLDWDPDTLLSHNLHNTVENFNHMKNAAESIRSTTSSALAILRTTESLLQSEKMQEEDNMMATSTPRLEESPTEISYGESESSVDGGRPPRVDNTNIVPKLDLREPEDGILADSTKQPLSTDTNRRDSDSHGPVMGGSVNSRDENQNPEATVEEVRNDDLDSNLNSNANSEESEPAVINFGAKEVDISKYPDYYIGDQPHSPRRQWEVNTESYSPRAEVVNRNKLQKAEEEVQHVEKMVESFHQPPTITMVTQSCDETSSLSPSLSVDSGFSSIREPPAPTVLCGETNEDDLPESRTEINAEEGVELPSVNRLKALFSHVKEDDSSLRRVHSITARNVPKEKLEQLRKYGSGDRESSVSVPGQSTLSVKLAHAEPRVRQIEAEPTQVFPEKKGELYPKGTSMPAKPARSSAQKQSLTITTSTKARAPQTPSQTNVGHPTSNNSTPNVPPIQSKGRAPQPPGVASAAVASSSPKPTGQGTVTPANSSVSKTATPVTSSSSRTATPTSTGGKGKARIRSGCINARASFWEKRIQGEETKEEEFPEMVEHVDE